MTNEGPIKKHDDEVIETWHYSIDCIWKLLKALGPGYRCFCLKVY